MLNLIGLIPEDDIAYRYDIGNLSKPQSKI